MRGSVVGLKEDNRDVVADVRITDSTGPSQIGKGIPRAEKEKIGKYGLASDANGLVFAPLVIEMLGQFSEKQTTISSIHWSTPFGRKIRSYFQKVSC